MQFNNTDPMWFIAQHQQSQGPFDLAEIKQMIAEQTITPETLVWHDGLAQWQKAGQTELAELFAQAGQSARAEKNSSQQWYVIKQGQQLGPLSEDDALAAIESPETLVWRDGMQQWQKAGQSELAQPFKQKEKSEAADFSQDACWYVMRKGRQLGPLSEDDALAAIEGPETLVWRDGMQQWQKAGQSRFAPLLTMMRPDYSPLSNNTVWIAAFSPLLGVFISALMMYSSISPEEVALLQQGVFPESYAWVIMVPLFLQTALGVLDLLKLKNAGHAVGSLAIAMVLVFPLYLFLRSRKLNDNYGYLIAYLICIGILMFA